MNFRLYLTILTFLATGITANAQVEFSTDQVEGCVPLRVKFTLDYTTIDTNTAISVSWDFGNGAAPVISFNPPPVTYTRSGIYHPKIVVNGNTGSPVFLDSNIVVHDPVSAEFIAEELDSSLIYQFVPIEDITNNVSDYFYRWQYYFEDTLNYNITYIVDNVTQENATDTFIFPGAGIYGVSLNIRDEYGCSDSTFQQLLVTLDIDRTQEFPVGNVFAPASHDFFVIDPQDPAVALRFEVFSRSGILVYKTESPVVYWDGKSNSGQDLNTGVYFYVLEAIQGDPDGYYSKRGFIHLFR